MPQHIGRVELAANGPQQQTTQVSPMNSDRTWPLPNRRYAMRMRWHDLLFIHWPVEPSEINRLLPSGMQVETLNGQAWIGLVPFRMSDVAPRGIPAFPWISAFPEFNIRTYVSMDGKPGVWFFSLDASNPVAVRMARTLFYLPYMDAKMSIDKREGWFDYHTQRTHRSESPAEFEGRYRPIGETFFAKPGTLEYWLTARYCLYAANRRGQFFRGEIDHPPWKLQYAALEIRKNTMLDWLSLSVSGDPHLLFTKDIEVRAWTNERVR